MLPTGTVARLIRDFDARGAAPHQPATTTLTRSPSPHAPTDAVQLTTQHPAPPIQASHSVPARDESAAVEVPSQRAHAQISGAHEANDHVTRLLQDPRTNEGSYLHEQLLAIYRQNAHDLRENLNEVIGESHRPDDFAAQIRSDVIKRHTGYLAYLAPFIGDHTLPISQRPNAEPGIVSNQLRRHAAEFRTTTQASHISDSEAFQRLVTGENIRPPMGATRTEHGLPYELLRRAALDPLDVAVEPQPRRILPTVPVALRPIISNLRTTGTTNLRSAFDPFVRQMDTVTSSRDARLRTIHSEIMSMPASNRRAAIQRLQNATVEYRADEEQLDGMLRSITASLPPPTARRILMEIHRSSL